MWLYIPLSAGPLVACLMLQIVLRLPLREYSAVLQGSERKEPNPYEFQTAEAPEGGDWCHCSISWEDSHLGLD